MRATEVLQKYLSGALGSIHGLRSRVLLRAVEAMIHGRRLTLMDLARAWPGAHRIGAPLKALDWSDLKQDGSWHLLRAAIPVGGRTLPILDRVFPAGQQGSPKAEKQFLQRLEYVLPDDASPILLTDVGFRTPWFRAVESMGWQWLGRLRNTPYLKPAEVPN